MYDRVYKGLGRDVVWKEVVPASDVAPSWNAIAQGISWAVHRDGHRQHVEQAWNSWQSGNRVDAMYHLLRSQDHNVGALAESRACFEAAPDRVYAEVKGALGK